MNHVLKRNKLLNCIGIPALRIKDEDVLNYIEVVTVMTRIKLSKDDK